MSSKSQSSHGPLCVIQPATCLFLFLTKSVQTLSQHPVVHFDKYAAQYRGLNVTYISWNFSKLKAVYRTGLTSTSTNFLLKGKPNRCFVYQLCFSWRPYRDWPQWGCTASSFQISTSHGSIHLPRAQVSLMEKNKALPQFFLCTLRTLPSSTSTLWLAGRLRRGWESQ